MGRGLAQAMGTLTKHGVKQVDRLSLLGAAGERIGYDRWLRAGPRRGAALFRR